jgi:hypothetical protein
MIGLLSFGKRRQDDRACPTGFGMLGRECDEIVTIETRITQRLLALKTRRWQDGTAVARALVRCNI